jgi:hypothetical protein
MSWRNDLEIIGHHVNSGGVWAGDQICKETLRKLRKEGYIGYDSDRMVYVPTVAGRRTWSRWRHIYAAWDFAMRLKWRVTEAISK